jgi:uncharacterized protein (TIGR01777 family)
MALHVVLAGGSGFLGSHLRTELVDRGHRVTRLVRRSAGAGESRWDPAAGEVDRDLVGSADVVVNLAGSPTLGNPHSKKWARDLRESRVSTTRVLAEAVAAAPHPPTYLAGNAVGWYGDHGDAVLDESADTRGHTLMTSVCRDWQAAAAPASEAGARVCLLRTAPVMDGSNAPLRQLRLLFLAGLGGRVGSGQQWMPMVSLRDWVGAVTFLAEHPSASGPVNISAPRPATNQDLTKALAAAVKRPALLPVPAPLVKVAAGPISPEALGSMRVVPTALLDLGFEFQDPGVEDIVATGLGQRVTS